MAKESKSVLTISIFRQSPKTSSVLTSVAKLCSVITGRIPSAKNFSSVPSIEAGSPRQLKV